MPSRSHSTPPGSAPHGANAPKHDSVTRVPGGRPCWVLLEPHEGVPMRAAAVLVEWRQTGGKWEGLVVYVTRLPDRDSTPAICQVWLPAGALRPVDEQQGENPHRWW